MQQLRQQHSRLRRLAPLGFALAAVVAISSGSLHVRASADVTVSQRNRQFSPDRLTVHPGAVIHIVNDDKVTHHIYVDTPDLRFDSGEQPVGRTVDLRFDKAGTFPVQCAIHPTMRLQVKVE